MFTDLISLSVIYKSGPIYNVYAFYANVFKWKEDCLLITFRSLSVLQLLEQVSNTGAPSSSLSSSFSLSHIVHFTIATHSRNIPVWGFSSEYRFFKINLPFLAYRLG